MAARRTSARAEPAAPPREPEDFDDVRELEDALIIDRHALDECLQAQPDMFYRVAKALALAISRRDAAKQALSDAEAEADLRARDEAEQKERKITEGEVRATVQVAASVVRARQRLQDLAEQVGKLAALKEAWQQRSYALKDLAGLYVANYYTASEHNAGAGAIRDRSAAEARERMSEERRRLGR